MCNLYSVTKGQEAMRRLFDGINDRLGNMPPLPGIFPDYPAPIIRNAPEGRELVMARWGMPTPPQYLAGKKTDPGVTNIRRLNSPHWRAWLGTDSRCLVPFTSFSENELLPDGSRPPVWFAFDETRPLSARMARNSFRRSVLEAPILPCSGAGGRPDRRRAPPLARGCCLRPALATGGAGYVDALRPVPALSAARMSRAPTFELLKALCRLPRLRREAPLVADALIARYGRDACSLPALTGAMGLCPGPIGCIGSRRVPRGAMLGASQWRIEGELAPEKRQALVLRPVAR